MTRGRNVSAPSAVLPDAARERAWCLLWQRLLQPIPDNDEPESDEPDDRDDDEEAA
jgi:hypothetical protein